MRRKDSEVKARSGQGVLAALRSEIKEEPKAGDIRGAKQAARLGPKSYQSFYAAVAVDSTRRLVTVLRHALATSIPFLTKCSLKNR